MTKYEVVQKHSIENHGKKTNGYESSQDDQTPSQNKETSCGKKSDARKKENNVKKEEVRRTRQREAQTTRCKRVVFVYTAQYTIDMLYSPHVSQHVTRPKSFALGPYTY